MLGKSRGRGKVFNKGSAKNRACSMNGCEWESVKGRFTVIVAHICIYLSLKHLSFLYDLQRQLIPAGKKKGQAGTEGRENRHEQRPNKAFSNEWPQCAHACELGIPLASRISLPSPKTRRGCHGASGLAC